MPENLSILCINMVVTKTFFSISKPNNPKIVRKYRAAWNFLQIYFVTLSDYANRIIIISIMKFYTSASLVLKSGLLVFRRKKSKISRDFQGQIRGKIGRFRGILAEKSQISKDFQGQILRKIGRFHGKFRGGNFAKKQSVKNSRFRWIFLANFAKIDQFCVDMTSVV